VIIVPGNNTVRPIGSHVSLAVGLCAGLALGLAASVTQSPLLLALSQRWLRPVGLVFMNLLSMVVIPLVATALFAGVAGSGTCGASAGSARARLASSGVRRSRRS